MGPITTGLGEIYQFVVRGDRPLADGARGDARLVHRAAAAHGARRRRGQQLRRRGQAVPGRPRSRSACRRPGSPSREVVRALERSNANAGGGYIEHNREHFVIGTDGLVKSLDDLRVGRHRRDAAGRPDHGRQRRRRALRPAPAARRRVDGRQGRGRRRRRADADGRELAHRHRAREGEARGAAADAARRDRDRAVLRPLAAGRTAPSRPSARTCSRARCWSSWCCSSCSATCAPG